MTEPATLTRADGSPPRVLVVDDEPNLAELLTSALRYEGWVTSTALSGGDAIRATIELAPDAVVLDIMQPDVDGIDVMRRIRTHQPDVPVLFLTARDAVEDRVAGLTPGGDDYVTKPFSLEELVARLRGLDGAPRLRVPAGQSLQRSRSRYVLPSRATPVTVAVPAPAPLSTTRRVATPSCSVVTSLSGGDAFANAVSARWST
ncbi:response regulator [Jiangella asiatica]|uniref:Response regulator transcription factor n=1 Tax=Jiangella asiatica TaxID=2530372 RepID=A0A4R5D5K8_9ACTN|nr:response regulator [Jiangella asiatica]TDE08759.1 response regulator transcription factor [Jiangella asiatica]